MADKDYMLTTIDNPFNPWVDYDGWYAYDERMGYHTCAYMARLITSSIEMTDEEQDHEYNKAMNAIIAHDPTGKYIRISKDMNVNTQNDEKEK